MRHTLFRYECLECKDTDAEIDPYHFDDVCAACRSYVEKTALCVECKSAPMFDGVDECVECWTQFCVDDPALIDELHPALKTAVLHEMAHRLRPVLTRIQAPRAA